MELSRWTQVSLCNWRTFNYYVCYWTCECWKCKIQSMLQPCTILDSWTLRERTNPGLATNCSAYLSQTVQRNTFRSAKLRSPNFFGRKTLNCEAGAKLASRNWGAAAGEQKLYRVRTARNRRGGARGFLTCVRWPFQSSLARCCWIAGVGPMGT